MAWRDVRASRLRFLLFTTTVTAGVAALVAIGGFSASLETAVARESKSFLGADLVLSSGEPFTEAAKALFDDLPAQRAQRVRTTSMVLFPRNGASRLMELVAVSWPFPLYGELGVDPPRATERLAAGEGVVVDHTVMLQLEIEVGDPIRIGELELPVAGRLLRVPGAVPAAALVAPQVLIPIDRLDDTGLVAFGSRVRYAELFELAPSFALEDWIDEHRDTLRSERLRAETARRREARIGRVLESVDTFLRLGALGALLLGAIGVASATHVQVRRKLGMVAVLRCLGAPARSGAAIFFVQTLAVGSLGSLLGIGVGLAVQALLPVGLRSFLPIDVPFEPHPPSMLRGVATGIVVALTFALPPLLSAARVPPLDALRSTSESRVSSRASWALYLLLTVAAVAVVIVNARNVRFGLWTSGVLLAVLLGLWSGSLGLRAAARRIALATLPYPVRQGVANLYRPGQQTLVVLVGLGFGVFALMTLYVAQATLLGVVDGMSLANEADVVLFDVQKDQVAGVVAELEAHGVRLEQTIPIVPMRLHSLEGIPVNAIDRPEIPRWALRTEYQVTYRNHLLPTEELAAGTFVGFTEEGSPPQVSIEEGLAGDLQLEPGDALEFNVQGVIVEATVGSLRRVEWEEPRPNFFVIFPEGVLEEAPGQTVLIGWAGSAERTAALQRAVIASFPNVSVIDLATVLATVEKVLGEIRFAMRFLALFSLAAGLSVLGVSLSLSGLERLRESALLRTLGASRRQLRSIVAVEFAMMGGLGATAAAALAGVTGWVLARWTFEAPFRLPWLGMLTVTAGVTAVTVAIGLMTSRAAGRRPPLDVLRRE